MVDEIMKTYFPDGEHSKAFGGRGNGQGGMEADYP